MGRPQYTRKDHTSHKEVSFWLANHNCRRSIQNGVVTFYHGGYIEGYPLLAVDISNIGGWVDWLIWIGEPGRSISAAWECKEPKKEKDLTDGEIYWRDYGLTLFYIIVTQDDCDQAAKAMLEYLRKE